MKSVYDNPYSEGQPQKKDWAKILDELTFENANREKLDKIFEAAASWSVCACGNLCKDIPRELSGSPLDFQLYKLGDFFATNIGDMRNHYFESSEILFNQCLSEARITHQKIEKRAAELLGIN